MLYSLLTYRPESKTRGEKPAFYVQSRGDNSGRPLHEPIANCFMVFCDKSDADTLYYLFFALWAGNRFKRYLHGTAVQLIRKGDLIEEVNKTLALAQCTQITKVYKQIREIDQLDKVLQQQRGLVKELRQALVAKFIHDTKRDL